MHYRSSIRVTLKDKARPDSEFGIYGPCNKDENLGKTLVAGVNSASYSMHDRLFSWLDFSSFYLPMLSAHEQSYIYIDRYIGIDINVYAFTYAYVYVYGEI